jgi:hypothetical protein
MWTSTLEDRRQFARLLLATLDRDKEKTLRIFEDMGFVGKTDDQDCLYLLAVCLFDQLDYKLAEEVFKHFFFVLKVKKNLREITYTYVRAKHAILLLLLPLQTPL